MCSTRRGHNGAWQKFERGEIALFPFYEEFGRDLSDTENGNVWYAEYCRRKGIGKSWTHKQTSSGSVRLTAGSSDCPELPHKLDIDGREVWVSSLSRYPRRTRTCTYSAILQLFGRMMREGAKYDDHMVEAIRRIRGKGTACLA